MGKFHEALKKAGTLKGQFPTEPASGKVFQVSTKRVRTRKREAVRTDTPVERSIDSSSGIDPRLICLRDPHSPEAERLKMLRTKLLVTAREKPMRSIMVTSAEPLDGKSLVAANLAVSISQGINDYVMLVDCDLRAPSVHRMFDLKNSRGIQEYLKEGTSVAPYLVKTSVQKLTLLLGGKPSPNPSELLCSEKMRLLVEELKSRYEDRYIIFDCPPAQFTAETAFLARMMDGVILVVRYGKTPRNLVSETIENIGRERIIGVVFNASLEHQEEYRYYYRYYRSRTPVIPPSAE